MKIIADESVNYFFVLELRQRGYQVLSVAENYPSIDDEDILSASLNPPAIVITEDKDFGELVFKHKKNCGSHFITLQSLGSNNNF